MGVHYRTAKNSVSHVCCPVVYLASAICEAGLDRCMALRSAHSHHILMFPTESSKMSLSGENEHFLNRQQMPYVAIRRETLRLQMMNEVRWRRLPSLVSRILGPSKRVIHSHLVVLALPLLHKPAFTLPATLSSTSHFFNSQTFVYLITTLPRTSHNQHTIAIMQIFVKTRK